MDTNISTTTSLLLNTTTTTINVHQTTYFDDSPESILKMKLGIAFFLFLIDVIFGLLPIFCQFKIDKLSKTISWINCFCGGFLLGSVLLQMLFESQILLENSLGHFPSAYLIFGLGYVFIMFFERWVDVITLEYKEISRGDLEESMHIITERKEIVKSNTATAYVLVGSCIVENIISSFAIGTQVDSASLWTLALMLFSTEWIQMFIFVFQFRQCKTGSYTSSASFLDSGSKNVISNDDYILDTDDYRNSQRIRLETILNVMIITFTNTIGIFLGNILSKVILGNNHNMQNICAGVLLAFVAGIFMHIATSQMIVKEFESYHANEYELLKKAGLIIGGLISSSILNIIMTTI